MFWYVACRFKHPIDFHPFHHRQHRYFNRHGYFNARALVTQAFQWPEFLYNQRAEIIDLREIQVTLVQKSLNMNQELKQSEYAVPSRYRYLEDQMPKKNSRQILTLINIYL